MVGTTVLEGLQSTDDGFPVRRSLSEQANTGGKKWGSGKIAVEVECEKR